MKIRSLLPELKNILLVSIVVTSLFLVYLYFIGIPKTRAAAYYRLAANSAGLGEKSDAEEFFNKAIESYPEGYILEEYKKFQSQR